MTNDQTRTKPSAKLLLGSALLAGAVGLAGAGAFAAFTDTETQSAAIDTGKLDLLTTASLTVSDLAPGDVYSRNVVVALPDAGNKGNLVKSVRLTIPTPTADQIGRPTDDGQTDTTPPGKPTGLSLYSGADGLFLTLRSCPSAWSIPASGSATTVVPTCATAPSTVLARTKVSAINGSTSYEFDAAKFGATPTTDTGTIPDGSTFYLLASFDLPTTAGNAYEDAALTMDLRFEALQRTGVNK